MLTWSCWPRRYARIMRADPGGRARSLKPGAVLLDLGSTKQEIVRGDGATAARRASHRRASDVRQGDAGLDAAEAALFQGATFVLTPLAAHQRARVALAPGIGRGRRRAASDHWSARAQTGWWRRSAICPICWRRAWWPRPARWPTAIERVWRLAAGGFRDTSRVAASDVRMMLDILLTNREARPDATTMIRAGRSDATWPRLRGAASRRDRRARRLRQSCCPTA